MIFVNQLSDVARLRHICFCWAWMCWSIAFFCKKNPLLTRRFITCSRPILFASFVTWRPFCGWRFYCCRHLMLLVACSFVCRRFQCNILWIIEIVWYYCTRAVVWRMQFRARHFVTISCLTRQCCVADVASAPAPLARWTRLVSAPAVVYDTTQSVWRSKGISPFTTPQRRRRHFACQHAEHFLQQPRLIRLSAYV